MSDTKEAGDGNSYSDDWKEIALEDAGQDVKSPPEASEGHDPPPEADGQGDSATPDSDADTPLAGSENTDDIWANADPRLKAAFAAERDRAAKAENLIRSNNGRVSQVQRELAELRAQQAKPQAQGSEEGPGVTDEELARVTEEYPDVAKPLIGLISSLQKKVEALSNDRTKQAELEATRAQLAEKEELGRQEQHLAEKHQDWRDVVASQDFAGWASNQPRMIQEAIIRNGTGIVDGPEAAKIVSMFKIDTSAQPDPLAAKRQRQMEGSRTIPSRTATMPSGSGREGTYEDEWKRQRELERREAQRR